MNLSRSKEFTGATLSHLYFHKFNPRSKDSVKHDDIHNTYMAYTICIHTYLSPCKKFFTMSSKVSSVKLGHLDMRCCQK